jgi:hypothetical protein
VGDTASSAVTVVNTGSDPFGPINMFGGAPPTAEFNASQNCQAQTLPAGGSCQVSSSWPLQRSPADHEMLVGSSAVTPASSWCPEPVDQFGVEA